MTNPSFRPNLSTALKTMINQDMDRYVEYSKLASTGVSNRAFIAYHGIGANDKIVYEHRHKHSDFLNRHVRQRELFEGLGKELDFTFLDVSSLLTLFYSNTDNCCIGGVIKKLDPIMEVYSIYGTAALREAVYNYMDNLLLPDDSVVIRRVTVDNRTGSLFSNPERITMPTACDRPDLFYPNLPDPKEVWDGFSASESKILLLQGDVGTGKSSYLRDMLKCRGWDNERLYIVDHTLVYKNEGLGDYLRGLPDESVVVFEDADMMLMKRTDGNEIMSTVLNSTSGIATTNVRLIFTTNLPNLKSVDTAFLRPGRTFRIMEFKGMSHQQARDVRQYMGKDPGDLTLDRDYTLAEAINYEEISHDLDSHGFGFV